MAVCVCTFKLFYGNKSFHSCSSWFDLSKIDCIWYKLWYKPQSSTCLTSFILSTYLTFFSTGFISFILLPKILYFLLQLTFFFVSDPLILILYIYFFYHSPQYILKAWKIYVPFFIFKFTYTIICIINMNYHILTEITIYYIFKTNNPHTFILGASSLHIYLKLYLYPFFKKISFVRLIAFCIIQYVCTWKDGWKNNSIPYLRNVAFDTMVF